MPDTNTQEIVEQIEDTGIDTKLPFKVILYNDDFHTFEEVIAQIIKATRCTFEKARDLTFEVHIRGQAVIYTGELNKCLKVSAVLEEIQLYTQVVS